MTGTLVSPPQRGYADWQRVGNYDEQPFITISPPAHTPIWNSAIFDVSRFAYIGGTLTATGFPSTVTISWYADPAGAVLTGYRTFQLLNTTLVAPQFRFTNLGAFVQVSIAAADFSTPLTINGSLFATNRPSALEMVPARDAIIDGSGQIVGPGATVQPGQCHYYAGPAMLYLNSTSALCVVTIRRYTTSGLLAVIWQQPTAAGDNVWRIIMPTSGCELLLTNNSGADQTFTFALIPSMTGAG